MEDKMFAPSFIEFALIGPNQERWSVYFDRENQIHVKGEISARELAVINWAKNKLREIHTNTEAQ